MILEHDAYQNYIPCKYTGKFSAHYRQLPWARVISSGYMVSERLRREGFDAVFVPKGYDEQLLTDQGRERDIELAFVGSTGSVAYSGRKALLDELGQVENLVVTRTKSGEDYCNTLNRIRFFVSADVGMGEYMIKNFEAMACGCVLLAYDRARRRTVHWVLRTCTTWCCTTAFRPCGRNWRYCATTPNLPSASRVMVVSLRCHALASPGRTQHRRASGTCAASASAADPLAASAPGTGILTGFYYLGLGGGFQRLPAAGAGVRPSAVLVGAGEAAPDLTAAID